MTEEIRISRTSIMNAAQDVIRKQATARGLANKPQDSMKAKWAAPLREQPWMAAVVVEVAFFARSNDFCEDDLPYEKIKEALAAKGTRLPIAPDLTDAQRRDAVRAAIHKALEVLREANPDWFEANIASELVRRDAELNAVDLDAFEAAPGTDSDDAGGARPRISATERRRHRPTDTSAMLGAELRASWAVAARRLSEELERLDVQHDAAAGASAGEMGAPAAVSGSFRQVVLEVACDSAQRLAKLAKATDVAEELDLADGSGMLALVQQAAFVQADALGLDGDTAMTVARTATEELLRAAEISEDAVTVMLQGASLDEPVKPMDAPAYDPDALSDAARAAMDLADAALGAAGHQVTDPVVRGIWARVASGEITGDEGAEELLALYKAGHLDEPS